MHADPYVTTVFARPSMKIRRLAAGEYVAPREHTGLELVTIMLHGRIVQLADGRRATLGPEDVVVRWAGWGTAIAMLAEEPAALFELSLRGRADLAPGCACYERPRSYRVERWDTLASTSTATIRAIVLPVGARIALRARGYVLSTVGQIAIDGETTEPGAAIAIRSRTCITALESTEIVAVTLR